MRYDCLGHTDDRPVRGPSARLQLLSASRAIAVMRYMVENGGLDPKLGTAATPSETSVPNDTRENRAKNRRVEFLCQRFTPKKTPFIRLMRNLRFKVGSNRR